MPDGAGQVATGERRAGVGNGVAGDVEEGETRGAEICQRLNVGGGGTSGYGRSKQ
jgi:hypothetical protein